MTELTPNWCDKTYEISQVLCIRPDVLIAASPATGITLQTLAMETMDESSLQRARQHGKWATSYMTSTVSCRWCDTGIVCHTCTYHMCHRYCVTGIDSVTSVAITAQELLLLSLTATAPQVVTYALQHDGCAIYKAILIDGKWPAINVIGNDMQRIHIWLPQQWYGRYGSTCHP